VRIGSLILLACLASASYAGSQRDAVCQGSCGGGCGPCPTSGGTSVAPQVAPVNPTQNMMNQMGNQIIMNGIQSLFQSDEKTPEQVETERQAVVARQQQAEQERLQRQREEAARRAQEETDHQKLKSELKLTGSDDLGIKRDNYDASPNLDPGPDDIKRHVDDEEKKDMPKRSTDAFNKGYEHASECFSQNSMGACGAVSAEQTDACLADYRNGYRMGDRKRRLSLDQAYHAGKQAGAQGELDDGASDARAVGPCRVSWIEAYNRGYYEGKTAQNHP
jgi:hypothetical protein